jgi:hypothetical protein
MSQDTMDKLREIVKEIADTTSVGDYHDKPVFCQYCCYNNIIDIEELADKIERLMSVYQEMESQDSE